MGLSSFAPTKRTRRAKRRNLDVCSGVVSVESPVDVSLFDLSVINDNPSLHGIQYDAVIQIGPAGRIPNLDPDSEIIF